MLKVGLIKTNTLLDIFYGIREPSYNIDPEEWKMVRASTALNLVKDKLERKKKILHMIYKSAYMQVSPLAAKDPFFAEKIPETFEEIKMYSLSHSEPTAAHFRRCSTWGGRASRRRRATGS